MYEICPKCNKQYFKLEEDLRTRLLTTNHLRKIEERINLLGGKIAQETEYPLKRCYKADLLCYRGKELIIIELKNYIANYDTFGQILHYILFIKKYHNSFRYDSIRGIVLAHRISEELRDIVMEYQNYISKIDLKEYCIEPNNQIMIDDSLCEKE